MTIPNLTHEQREALAELLTSKDVDLLREMLGAVYDAAIRAQFDQRNGTRTRGLTTRAGSIDLEIPRSRETPFRPTVIEQFRQNLTALGFRIQERKGSISRERSQALGPGRFQCLWSPRSALRAASRAAARRAPLAPRPRSVG